MKKIFAIISSVLAFTCLNAQTHSPYILVDQFGYLPSSNKVAIIRDPQTGYDASQSFTPSAKLSLINSVTNDTVFSAAPTIWNAGATDAVSGDKVWWFDFSSVNTDGTYYVKDQANNAQSATFVISDTAYKHIIKAAVRMLFYQRAGCAKTAQNAGIGWADGASHLATGQDKNARLYNNKVLSTERDLSGGWFDAGDYNKYTPWTANYVISLLSTYKENPTIFTDDYNIPESGNGVPDLLDEVKWGMDWLLKMQQKDGSCLSVMGLSHASPPSSATGASTYGPATTNATLRCAGAFAMGAKYLRQANPTFFGTYADTLEARALKAWTWGIANPYVKFSNSNLVAAGNQETDSLGRFTAKMTAALYLYDLTGSSTYLTVFENGISTFPLIAWGNYISQYFQESQNLMFHYLNLSGITSSKANQIKTATITAAKKTGDYIGALNTQSDPYRAFIKDYNWGSNQYKSEYGVFLWNTQNYNLDATNNTKYLKAAEEYLHYIHGVNPMNFVYLSNMSSYGAENNIKEFYHTWFTDKSAKWDKEGVSTYGPAPGYLVGGPNSSYSVDGCCPSGCGSTANNALCSSVSNLPVGQPAMKSYLDFNSNWPLNSWSVTENSNGYQVSYIRLLSKFVKNSVTTVGINDALVNNQINLSPNPVLDQLKIEISTNSSIQLNIEIFTTSGVKVMETKIKNGSNISTNLLKSGVYLLKIMQEDKIYTSIFIKGE